MSTVGGPAALVADPHDGGLRALIARHADRRPRDLYLIGATASDRVSFGRLDVVVGTLAERLDELCVDAGAPVLISVGDPVDYAVAVLGVVAAGRYAIPVDPAAPVGELARLRDQLAPAIALTDRPAELAAAGLRVAPCPRALPAGSTGPGDPDRPVGSRNAAGSRTSTGGILLHTSGSTGAPKTVRLDEAHLLHVARAIAEHNRLTPADRGFNALPLFHINAEVVAVLASLVAGSSLVLSGRFHRRGFWRALRELDVTWLNAVPAMLAILATEPAPPLPALRFVRSASAPLPPETRSRIESMVAAPVVESYGMTEAASQITATPLDGSAPAGSAGRPVGVELEVRDGTAAPSHIDTVGQVWIRGPGVVTSYAGGRAADRFDLDGWLCTGDMGRLDADGFLHLVGRSDEVINRGGEMVYPREVEEVLAADPRVREAVVVAGSHDVLGSVPVGVVLPHADVHSLDGLVDDLVAHCAQHLSRAKRPAALHVVSELPRASSGKVLRREVAAMLGTIGTGAVSR